jgi:outer membrane protein W
MSKKAKLSTNLILMGLVLLNLSTKVVAQDDEVLNSDVDDVLNNEQIDIDGSYQEKPKKTAADRIAEMRRKLEQKNEDMVQQKIEDMRIEQEKKLTDKLESALSGTDRSDEDMITERVAPTPVAPVVAPVVVAPVVAPAPAPVMIEVEKKPEPKTAKKTKVIPSLGGSTIQGERVDFESNLDLGISFESMLASNFSLGVAFNHSSMDIAEYDSSYYNNCGYYSNCANFGYQNGYNNIFSDGRQVKYKQTGLEVNAKIFLTSESTIKPYLGGGAGINRASIAYETNKDVSYSGYRYGDERHTFIFMSGRVSLGAEMSFSENFGFDVNAFFARTLTSGANESEALSSYNPDLRRLEDLGDQIKDADVLGIKAGLVIAF